MPPAWLALLVGERDGRACRFPGCEHIRGTNIHHLAHWVSGGPTELSNLVTLCARHHDWLHEGHYSMGGDPDVK